MKFPNAYEGVKMLFIAEIFHIIGLIFFGIGGGFTLSFNAFVIGFEGGIIGSGVLAGIGAILILIAFIIHLIGLYQAGKDEQKYIKAAFIFVVVGIILSIIAVFVPFLYTFREIICLVVFWLIIAGVMELANTLQDEAVKSLGKTTTIIILITYIIAIILLFLRPSVASTILVTIAMVLQIIGVIFFLAFLWKAKVMLAKE